MIFKNFIHHIYLCDEFIILDEVRDKYILLNLEASSELQEFLRASTPLSPENSMAVYLKQSDKCQYISTVTEPPYGIDNYEWRLSQSFKYRPILSRYVLYAACELIRTKFLLMTRGLHFVLQDLRKRKNNLKYPPIIDSGYQCYAEKITSNLSFSSRYMPFRNECLENSITLLRCLLQKDMPAEMKIGVQRYDFLAHAWVEVNGVVIGDDPDLPLKLPAILIV